MIVIEPHRRLGPLPGRVRPSYGSSGSIHAMYTDRPGSAGARSIRNRHRTWLPSLPSTGRSSGTPSTWASPAVDAGRSRRHAFLEGRLVPLDNARGAYFWFDTHLCRPKPRRRWTARELSGDLFAGPAPYGDDSGSPGRAKLCLRDPALRPRRGHRERRRTATLCLPALRWPGRDGPAPTAAGWDAPPAGRGGAVPEP